jgi:hypothetical protein
MTVANYLEDVLIILTWMSQDDRVAIKSTCVSRVHFRRLIPLRYRLEFFEVDRLVDLVTGWMLSEYSPPLEGENLHWERHLMMSVYQGSFFGDGF